MADGHSKARGFLLTHCQDDVRFFFWVLTRFKTDTHIFKESPALQLVQRMAQYSCVKRFPFLELDLPCNNIRFSLFVSLDDNIANNGLNDFNVYYAAFDLNIGNFYHYVAVFVVFLLNSVQVISEENPIEHISRSCEDHLK